jgi:hypothetical protein
MKFSPISNRVAIILVLLNISACVAGIGTEATVMPVFCGSDPALPMGAAQLAIVALAIGLMIGFAGFRFASLRWVHVALLAMSIGGAVTYIATISSSRVSCDGP